MCECDSSVYLTISGNAMSIMRNYGTRGRDRAYVEIEQDGGVGGREEREREGRGGGGGRKTESD